MLNEGVRCKISRDFRNSGCVDMSRGSAIASIWDFLCVRGEASLGCMKMHEYCCVAGFERRGGPNSGRKSQRLELLHAGLIFGGGGY